eukprot:gene5652-10884_t
MSEDVSVKERKVGFFQKTKSPPATMSAFYTREEDKSQRCLFCKEGHRANESTDVKEPKERKDKLRQASRIRSEGYGGNRKRSRAKMWKISVSGKTNRYINRPKKDIGDLVGVFSNSQLRPHVKGDVQVPTNWFVNSTLGGCFYHVKEEMVNAKFPDGAKPHTVFLLSRHVLMDKAKGDICGLLHAVFGFNGPVRLIKGTAPPETNRKKAALSHSGKSVAKSGSYNVSKEQRGMKLRITLDAKYPSKDPLDLIKDAQSKDYTVKESKGNSQGSEKDAHSKDYTVEELKRKGQGIEANLEIFPTRESFGKAIAEAFDRGSGEVKTQHWTCCLERHQDGGQHYHVAIKLTGPKRWVGVKEHLTKTFGIVVNFSEGHDNYYTAYKYICKSDDDMFKSQDHPHLSEVGSPRTKKCIKAFRASKLEERKRKAMMVQIQTASLGA